MSNPAVVKLEKNHVNKSMVWLDDNFGESIHIHIDDIRVDLSVQEFETLNTDLCFILNDLLRIENFDISKIDPVYLSLWLWPKLSEIKRVNIENVKLGDLLVRSMDGKKIEKLKESVELKALLQESNENDFYNRKSNHYGQSDTQRLQSILDSIRQNGYPYDGKYIILFDNSSLIRDGQHRASCLYFLYGNIDIPIMRLYFNENTPVKKTRFYHNRRFYNSKIGYFMRTQKKGIDALKDSILINVKSAMKTLLKKLGLRRYMMVRNISRLDFEIDSFRAR